MEKFECLAKYILEDLSRDPSEPHIVNQNFVEKYIEEYKKDIPTNKEICDNYMEYMPIIDNYREFLEDGDAFGDLYYMCRCGIVEKFEIMYLLIHLNISEEFILNNKIYFDKNHNLIYCRRIYPKQKLLEIRNELTLDEKYFILKNYQYYNFDHNEYKQILFSKREETITILRYKGNIYLPLYEIDFEELLWNEKIILVIRLYESGMIRRRIFNSNQVLRILKLYENDLSYMDWIFLIRHVIMRSLIPHGLKDKIIERYRDKYIPVELALINRYNYQGDIQWLYSYAVEHGEMRSNFD